MILDDLTESADIVHQARQCGIGFRPAYPNTAENRYWHCFLTGKVVKSVLVRIIIPVTPGVERVLYLCMADILGDDIRIRSHIAAEQAVRPSFHPRGEHAPLSDIFLFSLDKGGCHPMHIAIFLELTGIKFITIPFPQSFNIIENCRFD